MQALSNQRLIPDLPESGGGSDDLSDSAIAYAFAGMRARRLTDMNTESRQTFGQAGHNLNKSRPFATSVLMDRRIMD